jgi:hypothetical protein
VKTVSLVREDWDFERLLEGAVQAEIEVCYHYEFCRETPSICEAIALQRNFLLSLFGTDGARSDDHPILTSPEDPSFFLNYHEWPMMPYFQIHPATRKRRLGTLIPNETTDEALVKRLQAPLGLENSNIWPEVKLSIPIYYTHQQLIEAFAAYLRVHFAGQGKSGNSSDRKIKVGHEQGGASERRTQRNSLRALGVYRLCKTTKARQVLQLFERIYCGRQPYSDESAVNRAKALAKKHLAGFASIGNCLVLEST